MIIGDENFGKLRFIITKNLTEDFGNVVVVEDLNLKIPYGVRRLLISMIYLRGGTRVS